MTLEAISRKWIRVQGKARGTKKAQHTRQYVSIWSRPATPPWGVRRIFGMASNLQDVRGIVPRHLRLLDLAYLEPRIHELSDSVESLRAIAGYELFWEDPWTSK